MKIYGCFGLLQLMKKVLSILFFLYSSKAQICNRNCVDKTLFLPWVWCLCIYVLCHGRVFAATITTHMVRPAEWRMPALLVDTLEREVLGQQRDAIHYCQILIRLTIKVAENQ